MLTPQELVERIAAAKGRGPLARLAACELAAHYRMALGMPPIYLGM